MKRLFLITTLIFCGAVSMQANATTLAHHQRRHVATNVQVRHLANSIPRVGHFIDPNTGAACYNTGWATICDGGSAVGDEDESSSTVNAAQQAADQTADDINASIAQANGQ
jgi:hypothetical protein